MKKFENLVIVSVKEFNQGEPDKNGKDPIFLNVLAGKAPNRVVLSGTVAENAGFEVGQTYLAQVREGEPDETHGRQFSWNAVSIMSALEVVTAVGSMPKAEVFDAKLVENTIHANPDVN